LIFSKKEGEGKRKAIRTIKDVICAKISFNLIFEIGSKNQTYEIGTIQISDTEICGECDIKKGG
jgi:hypothetical protein